MSITTEWTARPDDRQVESDEYPCRAEAALRQLNERLEEQVEARTVERHQVRRDSRDLLFVIDTDGVFRTVDSASTAILGHRPE